MGGCASAPKTSTPWHWAPAIHTLPWIMLYMTLGFFLHVVLEWFMHETSELELEVKAQGFILHTNNLTLSVIAQNLC
eukprot:1156815-Pelagomonas_calceolata.AAC.6